jgi:hypothetical protein
MLVICCEEHQPRNQLIVFTLTHANHSLRATLVGELAKPFLFHSCCLIRPLSLRLCRPVLLQPSAASQRGDILRTSQGGLRGTDWQRLLKVWKSRRLTSGSVRKFNVERNECKAVAQVLTISQLDSLLLIWYSLSDDSRVAIWHDQHGEGNWNVLLDSVSVPMFCRFSCSVHKNYPFASSARSVLQFGRPVPQTEAKIVGGYGDAHKADRLDD